VNVDHLPSFPHVQLLKIGFLLQKRRCKPGVVAHTVILTLELEFEASLGKDNEILS
jgi:hypothetical protein